MTGVPEKVLFATKPQLADVLLDRAHALGIRAAFVAGDEVYGGRQLRRSIRQRGCAPGPRAPGTTTGQCSLLDTWAGAAIPADRHRIGQVAD